MYKVKSTNEILPLCAACEDGCLKDGTKLGFGKGLYYKCFNANDPWQEVEECENENITGQNCDCCGETLGEYDYN